MKKLTTLSLTGVISETDGRITFIGYKFLRDSGWNKIADGDYQSLELKDFAIAQHAIKDCDLLIFTHEGYLINLYCRFG